MIKIAVRLLRQPRDRSALEPGTDAAFRAATGVLEAVLLDNGHLTNIRTAAAGAVAAKHLAPTRCDGIGILGAGIQAELQLARPARSGRAAEPWSGPRIQPRSSRSSSASPARSLQIEAAADPGRGRGPVQPDRHRDAVDDTLCCVRMTSRPAPTSPRSARTRRTRSSWIRPSSALADLVVVDSLSQSESRGEVFRAVSAGAIDEIGCSSSARSSCGDPAATIERQPDHRLRPDRGRGAGHPDRQGGRSQKSPARKVA